MPGSARLDIPVLRVVAEEFGWGVKLVEDISDLAVAQVCRRAAVVLFHRDAVGREHSWFDAARFLRLTLPESRLVACHGFSELLEWPELSDFGVFHAVGLPLKENEVRQSLGFVWQALNSPKDSTLRVKKTGAYRAAPDRCRRFRVAATAG